MDRGSTVVKALCYKSEGRWFDPSWCEMRTLKVQQKFEPELDCLVSFNNDTDGLKSGQQMAV